MTDNDAANYGSDITQYADTAEHSSGTSMASLPFVKRVVGSAEAIDQARDGERSALSATGAVTGEIFGLAGDAWGVIKDPIGALANAGVTIVLDLVQPLDDLLLWVSGDAGEMQTQIDVLNQVTMALGAVDEEIESAANENLGGWEGTAADAAADQIGGLAASSRAVEDASGQLTQLLDWARMLADTIYNVIKAILSELVAWFITRGIAALASSVVTAGSSVLAFITTGILKANTMIMKALGKFRAAQTLFGKIALWIAKLSVNDRSKKVIWKSLLGAIATSIRKTATANASAIIDNVSDIVSSVTSPDTGRFSEVPGDHDGFKVDPEELNAAADAFAALVPNIDAISSIAAGAGAAEMTWGLTGLAFEGRYTAGAENLVAAINELGAALDAESSAIKTSSEEYRMIDESIALELDRLLSDL
ncbi:hypothetical protein AB0B28_03725 [Glycomyces sp. NPDC046736]|uniref:hypothetical protein n=1 Tax=Glycomyces sp. NPDC046736 TaxID=3155615 RepID=UPI0033FA9C26